MIWDLAPFQLVPSAEPLLTMTTTFAHVPTGHRHKEADMSAGLTSSHFHHTRRASFLVAALGREYSVPSEPLVFVVFGS